ncbi:MAG: Unknown protein [uncultured Sulfurovum sp.]|uniref:CRISPR-associated protein, TM1812 family n=1 Tax=uncultured Sulfurovum sp. TaxID=269237 RepID=A0A6S6TVW6_9BACT|nr:MAG: Unknown protein [uncultured Sulfurovum sp.]
MVVSILGTSGAFKGQEPCVPAKNEEGTIKFQSAKYHSEVLGKKSGVYKNATEFLLESYDDKFVFIGTTCAIDFQKIVLEEALTNKDVQFVSIEDDSLDDIFEKILELLQENDDVVLDITHGFRHQPIMAIFASTLSQFLERKDLKIIFAKEVVMFKEYRYIYLDEYIEITQISLLLTGFIRTFNFIPVKSMKLLNNEVFEAFSKSLLSNDMRGVEKNYVLLKQELTRLEENKEFKHISNLILKVKEELALLDMLAFFEPYQKYMVLSKLMVEKNYLIVALAYVFESVREYCSYCFEDICQGIAFENDYERNHTVMGVIGGFSRDNKIVRRYRNIYVLNKRAFREVNKLYNKLRKRRNDLAHINRTKEFARIKEDLEKLISDVEVLFNRGLLDDIKI